MKLAQHTYSSLFGTFVCNFLSERRRHKLTERTRSVWDYLDHHHVKFRNFLYEARLAKGGVDPLWPRSEIRDLLLWKDVYVVPDQRPTISVTPGNSSAGTNNSVSTASSSGPDSRCEDTPSTDQIDSGANNSGDEEEHNRRSPSKKDDITLVRDELAKLQVSNNAGNRC